MRKIYMTVISKVIVTVDEGVETSDITGALRLSVDSEYIDLQDFEVVAAAIDDSK